VALHTSLSVEGLGVGVEGSGGRNWDLGVGMYHCEGALPPVEQVEVHLGLGFKVSVRLNHSRTGFQVKLILGAQAASARSRSAREFILALIKFRAGPN